MNITIHRQLLAWFLLLLATSSSLQAASFNISPLRLDMSGRQNTAELSLKNQTEEAMAIQVKVLNWSQENGQDVLTESDDIFFSPPITNVPAGTTQLVRFRLKRGADAQAERSYRVFAEQLPKNREQQGPGMNMRIRFSIPLFVAPLNAVYPSYTASAVREGEVVRARLHNTGQVHLKVNGASLFPADVDVREPSIKQLIATQRDPVQGNVYLLPGSSAEWLIPLKNQSADGPLKAVLETDYYNYSGRGDIRYDGNLWLDVTPASP